MNQQPTHNNNPIQSTFSSSYQYFFYHHKNNKKVEQCTGISVSISLCLSNYSMYIYLDYVNARGLSFSGTHSHTCFSHTVSSPCNCCMIKQHHCTVGYITFSVACRVFIAYMYVVVNIGKAVNKRYIFVMVFQCTCT